MLTTWMLKVCVYEVWKAFDFLGLVEATSRKAYRVCSVGHAQKAASRWQANR